MTNTGKMLIIGLLVIDAGVAGYLLFPKEEERPPAVTGAVVGSAGTAAIDSRASESHVVAGSVARTSPAGSATDKLAAVAPATPVKLAPDSPATTVAPVVIAPRAAPAVTAAPNAGPTTRETANGAHPATRTLVASNEVHQPAHTKPKHAEHGRERKHDEPRRSNSNHVSAALTAQLVRESAKPDPSLPLPPGTGSGSTGKNAHPVASAMTDQLVRESSRVNLSAPSQSYKH